MYTYQAPQDLLADKTILVTGASDGIGKTLALTLADHGATVIMLGRSQEKLEAVYDELEHRHPGRAVIHPMDFVTAGPEDYRVLANSLMGQFPCLDGLVHNAGMLGARMPIEFYPEKDWQEVMQVNVNAVFYLTKALLPALTKAADARLLLTSSSVGRQSRAYWGAYAVSKFATEGLMQTLAEELEATSKVRVNSINPGGTRTAMRARAYPAEEPGTQPTPEELMPVYLFLFSPEAQPIHGRAIDVRDFDPADYLPRQLAREPLDSA
ncbi:MAG: YciK family oxidoreductase [Pseudohongiellaceae bacterium]